MEDISSSGLSTSPSVSVSDQFTQYHEIHSEGFNVLFRAQASGKWFIIKGLKKEFRHKTEYRCLLDKEYELGKQLHHSHIVKTISRTCDEVVGECIVLEYVDGISLKEFLKKGSPLSVRKRIAEQILSAMDYFHQKQIIHRDLKPANILITKNGNNVKIIDFGLSDSDTFAILKQSAGTPRYMAPEQLKKGVAIDCRTDIYAFGLILQQLCPHYLPWKHVARKCSARNREKRYHSAGEVSRSMRIRQVVFPIICCLLAAIVLLGLHFFHNSPNNDNIVNESSNHSLAVQADTTLDGKPCPGMPTLTDIDGNVYETIQLGCQCWMRENLRTTRYANGETIPLGTDTNTFVAYRYYPNHNTAELMPTFGYLYNWRAAMGHEPSSGENPSGVQGICPDGWHLPSDAEWNELEHYLIAREKYACSDNAEHIGKALASKEYWADNKHDTDLLVYSPGFEQEKNNATGFNALPAGDFFHEENYFGMSAYFWTSTELNAMRAPYRYVDHDQPVFGLYRGYYKAIGRSVRCVKD